MLGSKIGDNKAIVYLKKAVKKSYLAKFIFYITSAEGGVDFKVITLIIGMELGNLMVE